MKGATLRATCFACVLAACSSTSSTSGGTTDGSSGSDGGSTGGSSGSSCTSVTGNYTVTGTRDAANPGSCPNDLVYTTEVATLTKGATTYDLKIFAGATTSPSSANCTASVTGCTLNASCQMFFGVSGAVQSWQSDYVWTFTSTGAIGTDKWTNYSATTPHCSANWNITAVRQ